jgi:hypothetical protein
MAKPSEGINFPSMNNIDSELPGVKLPKSSWRPFDGLLDHLKGVLIDSSLASFEVGRAFPVLI